MPAIIVGHFNTELFNHYRIRHKISKNMKYFNNTAIQLGLTDTFRVLYPKITE